MSAECSDCKEPPGPGSIVRLFGTDHAGNPLTLCSVCWISRDRDVRSPVKLAPAKVKRR
jgi:hypothetical protein